MKVALFVFGVVSGAFAFLVAVGAVWVAAFGLGKGLERQSLFFNMSGVVSAFATLGGLCFVAAAIARHAELPSPRFSRSSDEPRRARPTAPTQPVRDADAEPDRRSL